MTAKIHCHKNKSASVIQRNIGKVEKYDICVTQILQRKIWNEICFY